MANRARAFLIFAKHLEAIAGRVGAASLMAGFAGLGLAALQGAAGFEKWASLLAVAMVGLWSLLLFVSILPMFLEDIMPPHVLGNQILRLVVIVPVGTGFGLFLLMVLRAGYEGYRALSALTAALAQ